MSEKEIQELQAQLNRTTTTLGTLINWLVLELGVQAVEELMKNLYES